MYRYLQDLDQDLKSNLFGKNFIEQAIGMEIFQEIKCKCIR